MDETELDMVLSVYLFEDENPVRGLRQDAPRDRKTYAPKQRTGEITGHF